MLNLIGVAVGRITWMAIAGGLVMQGAGALCGAISGSVYWLVFDRDVKDGLFSLLVYAGVGMLSMLFVGFATGLVAFAIVGFFNLRSSRARDVFKDRMFKAGVSSGFRGVAVGYVAGSVAGCLDALAWGYWQPHVLPPGITDGPDLIFTAMFYGGVAGFAVGGIFASVRGARRAFRKPMTLPHSGGSAVQVCALK